MWMIFDSRDKESVLINSLGNLIALHWVIWCKSKSKVFTIWLAYPLAMRMVTLKGKGESRLLKGLYQSNDIIEGVMVKYGKCGKINFKTIKDSIVHYTPHNQSLWNNRLNTPLRRKQSTAFEPLQARKWVYRRWVGRVGIGSM